MNKTSFVTHNEIIIEKKIALITSEISNLTSNFFVSRSFIPYAHALNPSIIDIAWVFILITILYNNCDFINI